MNKDGAGLFEEYRDRGDDAGSPCLPGALGVRPARIDDIVALGRIAAEREGGAVDEYGRAFRRALECDPEGRGSQVLVAVLADEVVAYGKAHRFEEGGESPIGWYLSGLIVDPRFRRCGVGARLTAERLAWIAARSPVAYYFANARNRVSIALHERFGFAELARGPEFCGVTFAGGEGILFKAELSAFTPGIPNP